jgi:hypothetical protein
VEKLDLLTGGITLSAKQAAAINDCLKDIEKPAKMSDDDAEAKHDELMDVLFEEQKERLEAIELSQSGHGGKPGACCPLTGCPVSGTTDIGAAPKQDDDGNPFQQAAVGQAVQSLRKRLASKALARAAETSMVPPAKAEGPKAPPAAKAAPPAKALPPKAGPSKTAAAKP